MIVPFSGMDEYLRTPDIKERIMAREIYYQSLLKNEFYPQSIMFLREIILLKAEKIKQDHCI